MPSPHRPNANYPRSSLARYHPSHSSHSGSPSGGARTARDGVRSPQDVATQACLRRCPSCRPLFCRVAEKAVGNAAVTDRVKSERTAARMSGVAKSGSVPERARPLSARSAGRVKRQLLYQSGADHAPPSCIPSKSPRPLPAVHFALVALQPDTIRLTITGSGVRCRVVPPPRAA